VTLRLGIFQAPGSGGLPLQLGNIPGAGQRGIAVAIGQMVNMPWGGVQGRLAEFAPLIKPWANSLHAQLEPLNCTIAECANFQHGSLKGW
jgi:hypothetical protein